VIARADNKFVVSGALTIDSVKAHQSLAFAPGDKRVAIEVDMAKVDVVDSAAVSLMLSWLRQAKALDVELSFVHAPTNLRSLVDLYGLSEVLPLNYS
jgi:phospholipid transport system transporter-binding protein